MELAGSLLQTINDTIWNPEYWLPPNVTWGSPKIKNFANFNDLYYAIPLSILFFGVRFVIERLFFEPLGIICGIKKVKRRKVVPNAVLEKAFQQNGKISDYQVRGLAKQLDWSERKVERWIRCRTYEDRPTALTKVTETGWRLTFYSFMIIYGGVVLYDRPWMMDFDSTWKNYPYDAVSPDIWWYYLLELSFYTSLLVSQFVDIKRKDFWQMMLHHIITIILLVMSFAMNAVNLGSVVMMLHDAADVPLEAAKLARYLNYKNVCTACFAIFAIVWFITRLGIFPIYLLHSTLVRSKQITIFRPYIFFNTLLLVLQVLHIIWSWMILRVLYRALFVGELDDVRSSDEESDLSSSDSSSKNSKSK